MKNSKPNLINYFHNFWPFCVIILAVAIFFYPVWSKNLFPIPADFVVGTYFPWLDYKWGYSTGVPVKNPITTDVVSVIYPLRNLGVNLIKEGKIPFWTSGMFTGYPLLANFQAALLSPTILLYLVLPKIWAWTGQIVLQPILGAIFMYLFLRNIKLGKLASIGGGIAYAFSGFNIIWLEWNAHALVAAFIPLIFLLADKLVITGKLKWGVFLSIALCFQILSGYPQLVFYTLLFLLPFLIIVRKNELKFKRLISLVIFSSLGLMLSSIQLIPAIELFGNSQRLTEFVDAAVRYLPWQNLINFFAPDYYGNPSTYNFWGRGNYTLNAGYTGIIAIFLATIGTKAYLKAKTTKLFLIFIFICLFISLPNPISKIIAENGNFGLAALSPTRILIFINFSLTSLAAFGIEKLLNKKSKLDIRSLYFPAAVLVGVFLGTFVALKLIPQDYFFVQNLKVAIRNLVFPSFLILFVFGLSVVRYKYFSKKVNIFAIVGIIFLWLFELFRFGWKYTPFSPKSLLFPETPIISYLIKKEAPFRISEGDTIPMNMWLPYNLESLSGYDAVYPLNWAEFVAAVVNGNTNPQTYSRFAKFESYDSPWLDILNVKYLLALKLDKEGRPKKDGQISYRFKNDLAKVYEDGSVVILENKNAFPRSFFVSQWQTYNKIQTFKELQKTNFPFDKKIILEEDFYDFTQSENVSAEVKYLSYDSQKSKLEVTTQKDGFLFVSESFYPGWEAFVDGKEEKIYKADYAFRAVPIKSGTHVVEFIYQPKSFRIGKWISVSAFLILLGNLFYERFAKKRR